jgi:DNA topoisomerase-1
MQKFTKGFKGFKKPYAYKKVGGGGGGRGGGGGGGSAVSERAKFAAARYLIIVESPSKCAKIEKYLGTEYACIAIKGHLRSLNSLKSIHKETFEIEFENIAAKVAHISWMRSVVGTFDKGRVILASDNDREGEAIAWHICMLFDLPVATTQRIVFSEITEAAIRQAVQCPTVINMNLVYAQHARQILDVLVGFQISPLLWKYLFFDKSKQHALSAGRCQTPALRIVHDREVASRLDGAGLLQYKIFAWFFPKSLCFSLNRLMDSGDSVREFMELSKTHNHCMTIGDPARKVYAPPAPFNTSRLLQTVSNRLHISPSETMRICQTLYQDGWITYMRSECKKYCKEFLDKGRTYVLGTFSEKHVGNLSAIQNEDKYPHEAIRVTNLDVKKGDLGAMGGGGYEPRTLAVYHLIWTNTIQSCMAPAEYTTVRLTMTAPMDALYFHVLETPVFLGWRQTGYFGDSSGQGSEEGEDVGTGSVSEGSSALLFYLKSRNLTGVPLERIESAVTIKGGHTHYTESALIQRLEDLGIGRPSTYSTIIETIKEREYVKKQDIEGVERAYSEYKMVGAGGPISETKGVKRFGNEKAKLAIQSLGQIVVEFLVENFSGIFSYDYTSRMESDLDEIARGGVKYSEICKKYNDEILALIKSVKKGIKKNVYVIDDEHTLMFEKYGPVICKTTKCIVEAGAAETGTPVSETKSKRKSVKTAMAKMETKTEFLSVNREITIDLEKLKAQKYTVSELLEKKPDLGEYEGNVILVKHGPYGDYIECGDKKHTLKDYKGKISELTRVYVLTNVMGVMGVLDPDNTTPEVTRHVSKNAVLRKFSETLCIKNGRYGAYAFYDLADGKKPQFFNIKKYPGDWRTCQTGDFLEWVKTKYGIS